MAEQLPIWRAPGVEPPENLKTNGWQAGMKPAAEHMNWLLNQLSVLAAEAGVTVEDLLTSDSAVNALSAKQGKLLKSLIDGKANASHTHTIANVTGLQEALEAKANDVDLSNLSNNFNTWLNTSYTPLRDQVTQHLAHDALIKHKANQISFAPPTGMQATNMQDGLVEAFLLGNSRKQDLVDKLLLIDPSLPITHESTWSEILAAITMISTGKKWAVGNISVNTANKLNFNLANGGSQAISFVQTSISFEASFIFVFAQNTMTSNHGSMTIFRKEKNLSSQSPNMDITCNGVSNANASLFARGFVSDGTNAYVNISGFRLPFLTDNNVTASYLAIE